MPNGDADACSRGAADRIDVARGMDQTKGFDASRARREHLQTVDDTRALRQQPGQLPPQRIQRVIPAEVIVQHAGIPNHRRTAPWPQTAMLLGRGRRG